MTNGIGCEGVNARWKQVTRNLIVDEENVWMYSALHRAQIRDAAENAFTEVWESHPGEQSHAFALHQDEVRCRGMLES